MYIPFVQKGKHCPTMGSSLLLNIRYTCHALWCSESWM